MRRRALDLAISTSTFDLRRLADRVEEQTAVATHALASNDAALARRLLLWDEGDRALRRKIEREAVAAIASHQPTARDMRCILAAMHMAHELERAADHASGIARLTIRIHEGVVETPAIPPAILGMQPVVCAMLRRAMRAYVDRDADLAVATVAMDDEVDALHVQALRVMLTYMMQDRRLVAGATYLVWAAHDLERIGDHATNLCERALFAVRGGIVDLRRDAARDSLAADPPHPADGRELLTHLNKS